MAEKIDVPDSKLSDPAQSAKEKPSRNVHCTNSIWQTSTAISPKKFPTFHLTGPKFCDAAYYQLTLAEKNVNCILEGIKIKIYEVIDILTLNSDAHYPHYNDRLHTYTGILLLKVCDPVWENPVTLLIAEAV